MWHLLRTHTWVFGCMTSAALYVFETCGLNSAVPFVGTGWLGGVCARGGKFPPQRRNKGHGFRPEDQPCAWCPLATEGCCRYRGNRLPYALLFEISTAPKQEPGVKQSACVRGLNLHACCPSVGAYLVSWRLLCDLPQNNWVMAAVDCLYANYVRCLLWRAPRPTIQYSLQVLT